MTIFNCQWPQQVSYVGWIRPAPPEGHWTLKFDGITKQLTSFGIQKLRCWLMHWVIRWKFVTSTIFYVGWPPPPHTHTEVTQHSKFGCHLTWPKTCDAILHGEKNLAVIHPSPHSKNSTLSLELDLLQFGYDQKVLVPCSWRSWDGARGIGAENLSVAPGNH